MAAAATALLTAAALAPGQDRYGPEPISADGLRGIYGFEIEHEGREPERFGRTIDSAGDLNNDGAADFVVTAFEGFAGSQAAYVFFGRPGGGFPDLTTVPTQDFDGFAIVNDRTISRTSIRFARTIGDLNADGVDDLFVSADGSRLGYVLYGRPNGQYPKIVNFSEFGPRDGIILELTPNLWPRLTFSPWSNGALAGDVNGDGVDDAVFSFARMRDESGHSACQAYVLYGSADGLPARIDPRLFDGADGFLILPESGDDLLGVAVDGAGDVNGDGFADVVLGASGDVGSRPFEILAPGKAHVVFGGPALGAVVDVAGLDGTNGFTLRPGPDRSFGLGYGVAGVGDLNGDGRDDVAFGAPSAGDRFDGRVFVLFGAPWFEAEYRTDAIGEDEGGVFLDSSDELVRKGLGWSVAAAGDVNADGRSDIIIGAPSIIEEFGRAHVVFGRSGGGPLGPGGVFDVATLDGESGVTITSPRRGGSDYFGARVGGLGDIDVDGNDDIGITAEEANLGAGEAFVHLSGGFCPPDANGDGRLDAFDVLEFLNQYQARQALGDWNSDGFFSQEDLAAFLNDFDAGCP
ncbi:MAG: GC-type dockerin domain-anchored protein [Phycisphaerales bacterium]